MKRAFFLLIIMAVLKISSAQTPSPVLPGERTAPGNTSPAGKNPAIKGVIIEKTSQAPLEYANIAVYSVTDNSVAGGVMSSANGTFEIKNLKPGKYYVSANFIGFEKKTIENIVITADKPSIDLGRIELKSSDTELGEVAVVADKARVEFKIDRRVVNVSQDITATGGTAIEVLENTPSVQTDFEGNITLRGSSEFTVLIDGKPSVLKGSDALRQIPAVNIENIEIITNPSAKYDPDGTTGIINVVLKKTLKDSFSGLLNLTAGVNDKYRGDATFNYRTGKWNLMLGGNFSDMNFDGTRESIQKITSGDTITTRETTGNGSMNHGGNSLKGGIEYNFSKKSSLGINGTFGKRDFGNANTGKQIQYNSIDNIKTYEYQDNSSSRSGDYWSTDINFMQRFAKPGHEIQALLYFSGDKSSDSENMIYYPSDSSWNPIDNQPPKNRSVEAGDGNEYRLKVDYTLPLNENDRLEAGYQVRMERTNESFVFDEYDYGQDDWVNNPNFSSSFDFMRDIHAFYGTFSHAKNNFSYQLGIRGEYTNRNISSAKATNDYKLERFDWFPTIHLSQKFGKDFELQTSYSRRLNRPNGWSLEPFPSYMDQYNIRIGNPRLGPEYTSSYELTLLKRIDRSFVSLEGYYRNTQDLMTRVQTLGDDGIMYHTMENLNNDNSLGAELLANMEVKPGFRIIASGTYYRYWLNGEINGESVDQKSNNFDARLNFDLKLAKYTRVQLTGVYRGPSVSAQGRRESMLFSNASLRQDFFKQKLTATLQVQDLFGTMRFKGSSYGTNFENVFTNKRESQVVQLTLSYKINNFKNKAPREGSDMNQGGEGEGMGGGDF